MSTPEMYYVMDIHSHNTMPAFFSSIDNADEKANRVYGVVGGFGGVPEMKLRAATGGKFVSIALPDVFEENGDGQEYISAQALYDEWRAALTLTKTRKKYMEDEGRYYVIDRYRQMITSEYIREDPSRFKNFDTYDEAYSYKTKAFFDDSDYDIFYRTEDDKFLRIVKCL